MLRFAGMLVAQQQLSLCCTTITRAQRLLPLPLLPDVHQITCHHSIVVPWFFPAHAQAGLVCDVAWGYLSCAESGYTVQPAHACLCMLKVSWLGMDTRAVFAHVVCSCFVVAVLLVATRWGVMLVWCPAWHIHCSPAVERRVCAVCLWAQVPLRRWSWLLLLGPCVVVWQRLRSQPSPAAANPLHCAVGSCAY